MKNDEGFRVLGFDFEKGEIFREYGLKSESVGSEVKGVFLSKCF